MKNYKITALALSVLALASCADKAQFKGVLTGAPGRQIIVKELAVNVFNVLDTIKTSSDGSFSYKLDVAEGQPEFVYLFCGDTRVAAMLLEKGEKAEIVADTLGNYTVSGSEGSEKLRQVEICKAAFGKILGHNNLYPAGGEEPGLGSILSSRNGWRAAHEAGQLVLCNGGDRRNYCGYQDDFRVGGGFADRRESDFMHRIKGKIGNYAGPHTGPENPDYMRRMHGLNLYKKDYDMMYNYGYIEGDWNDQRNYCYRITLVYETKDGYIDTIPWEGIREGLDDIRYATLLMTLAERAVAEGKKKDVKKYYTGRKALQFLANVDEEKCDLNAVRLEMIRHIEEVSHVL